MEKFLIVLLIIVSVTAFALITYRLIRRRKKEEVIKPKLYVGMSVFVKCKSTIADIDDRILHTVITKIENGRVYLDPSDQMEFAQLIVDDFEINLVITEEEALRLI